ncbi:MAG: MFS transporter [Caulobacter sp.]
MEPNASNGTGVRPAQLAAWSLVGVIGSMMIIPLNTVIPAFFAKHTAANIATVGLVLMAARLYDAFADPTIGFLSDRTRGRLGRRKPWLLAGAVLASISGYLLFNPRPDSGGVYLLFVCLAFYTAFSMLSVPHSAWGSELSRSYRERSMISGMLTFAGVGGLLLFMGLPVLLSSPILPLFETAEMTPPMLRLLGWLLVIAAPVCVIIPVLFTPAGEVRAVERMSLRDLFASMRSNRPFWLFVAAYVLNGLAYGVYYATTYMFLDSYMGLADKFPLIYATGAFAQMLSIPVWTKLAQRFERHRIWALGIGAFGLLLPLRLLIPEGDLAFPLLMALVVVASFANAASQVPQMAVLADCIDYGELTTGKNLAGSYYAWQQFVLKAALAAGGGLAFFALAVVGFDAKTDLHSRSSLEGLSMVHTFGPLLLFVAAGALVWIFPITRSRQTEIRMALEARALANP